jgi:hypothetical protein
LNNPIRIFCLLGILFLGNLSAQNTSNPAAVIVKMKGGVLIQEAGKAQWIDAKKGQSLFSGTKIKTQNDGMAMVKFLDDKSMMEMKPKTLLTIETAKNGLKTDKKTKIDIGAVLFNIKSRKAGERFEVKTPTSVATVKGTQFWVIVNDNGKTFVVTLENFVELLNNATGKKMDVGPGQTGISDASDLEVRTTQKEDLEAASTSPKL